MNADKVQKTLNEWAEDYATALKNRPNLPKEIKTQIESEAGYLRALSMSLTTKSFFDAGENPVDAIKKEAEKRLGSPVQEVRREAKAILSWAKG